MKNIFIYCNFLWFLLFGCSQKTISPFREVSKSISKEYKRVKLDKGIIKVFSLARKSLEKKTSMENLINSEEILLVEYYDYQNGTVYSRMWSNSDTIDYSYNVYKQYSGERLVLNPQQEVCCRDIFFIFITDWNIDAIRMMKTHYPEYMMYATKISNKGEISAKMEEFKMPVILE